VKDARELQPLFEGVHRHHVERRPHAAGEPAGILEQKTPAMAPIRLRRWEGIAVFAQKFNIKN